MKNIKIKPVEDVKYTFIFKGKKRYTFVYYGENPNGRLLFYNETIDKLTNMSPGWFANLVKNNLISAVKDGKPFVVKAEKQVKKPINKPVEIKEETDDERELRLINALRSMSYLESNDVIGMIGITPLELADNLEYLRNSEEFASQEFINLTFRRLMKISPRFESLKFNI